MYDEEDSVIEEQIMANETIQNTATKVHVQRLFGMNNNSFSAFKIEGILGVNIRGDEALFAFNWTNIEEKSDRNLLNADLYYGHPIMLMKIYMTAQLWLNSGVVFPYLVAIGQEEPMYLSV